MASKTKTISKSGSAKRDNPAVKKDTVKDFTFKLIPEKWQTPVFLVIIFFLLVIFFKSGLFENKVFSSADNIASASFQTFLDDAKKEGIFPLWMPYIFNGMPSFAALIDQRERMYDISHAVWVTARNFLYMIWGNNSVWEVLLFYVIFAFGFYFLAEYKFKNKIIAFYCAVAAVFITPIIQFIIVGHNTKMIAIMMFPAVFLFLEKIYDMFSAGTVRQNIYRFLLFSGLVVFFAHVQMSSNHIQMLFYFYVLYGSYFTYRLIYSLVKKEQSGAALKTLGVLIISGGLSVLMYADSFLSSKEYSKYSIRGAPPITNSEPGKQKESTSGANDYQYSTQWSFSPAEVMTFIIPSWVGFGDVEYKGQQTNTYWGQMPFTTSPVYFGIITLLLAFIGIYYNFKKNSAVQALTLISFLALVLSFGYTVPILYDILFYNMPYFSSFRAPVMVQILIYVSFVLLAGYGIKSIIDTAKDKARSARFLNSAKYIFPLLGLPVIFSLIGFENYYTSLVQTSSLIDKVKEQGASAQQIQQYVSQVASIAYSNVKSEMLVIGLLLLLTYGVCYLLIKGNIKYQLFAVAISVLVIFDLWHIDFKTLHWDNKADSEFKTPDYVDWILKNEKDTYSFRVLNLQKGQPVRENTLAYWRLENIYGYHGAKLRIYQDMDDVVGLTNPNVWKFMNTKYIISDQPYTDSMFTTVFKGSKTVMRNNNYYPKAFFVSSYKTAQGIDILNNIKDGKFDPKQLAYLEKDPNIKIDAPDSTAKVQITGYGIHEITLDAEASGNNLLYLSEVYYPAGWNAYIDGQPTEIFKTDYLFRSIIVPKGKHKIEFKFEPETYYTGKKIAVGSNIILILIFITGIGGMIIKHKKSPENTDTPTQPTTKSENKS